MQLDPGVFMFVLSNSLFGFVRKKFEFCMLG